MTLCNSKTLSLSLYYLIERIVAEKRRGLEQVYVIKWQGYPDSFNTESPHSFLVSEPGSKLANEAWQAHQTSVPAPATTDRTARHR